MAEDKSENENPSARLVSIECAVQWIKRGCRLSKPIFQIEGKLPGRKDFYYREICRAVFRSLCDHGCERLMGAVVVVSLATFQPSTDVQQRP